MTPSDIKPGMKFGNWEVIKFDHVNKHRIKYFLCKCSCGAIRPVRATALIDKTSTACSKKCSDNLTGQVFGEWTVLKRDLSRPRYYICRCSCGTIRSVFGSGLKYGGTLSCGCKSKEHSKQKNKKNAKNHIGEVHGWLTIESCFLKGKSYWYNCKCKCGNNIQVIEKNLFSGNTCSCGCMNSYANEQAEKIIKKYKIPYKREFRIEDCKDKNPLPFDMALFNNESELIGLIELNGSLHYSSSGTGWDTPERLLYVQKHDYIKRKFCEDNKIPLLIVPYQFFNELEKFIVTSDFWQIITKNFND